MNASAALDAARAQYTGAATADAPPSALWEAAESVLRASFDTPALREKALREKALRGQALVGEGRRLQAITLADAHALVALLGWVDRLAVPPVIDDVTAQWRLSRDGVAASAWTALEHAAAWQMQQQVVAGASTWSRDPTSAPIVAAPAAAPAPATLAPTPVQSPVPPSPRRFRPWLMAAAVLAVTVLGVVFYQDGARDRGLTDAISAYGRGDRSAARAQLIAFANTHAEDGRPLIYLGRIAREDGDLPTARRYLQSATTKAPANPLAHRELAATLLAAGDVELARRFYVRAVELDPTDRLAQGFLACTLHRLGRDDDAQRFAARAGDGEWSSCLAATAPRTPASPSPNTTR